MKIYFIPSSVPELAALPREQRDRVWRYAKRSAMKKEISVWVGILLVSLLAGIGALIGHKLALPQYVGGPIAGVIGWYLFQPFFIRAVLPYIRECPPRE